MSRAALSRFACLDISKCLLTGGYSRRKLDARPDRPGCFALWIAKLKVGVGSAKVLNRLKVVEAILRGCSEMAGRPRTEDEPLSSMERSRRTRERQLARRELVEHYPSDWFTSLWNSSMKVVTSSGCMSWSFSPS